MKGTHNGYGFNVCVVLEIDGMQHTTYVPNMGDPTKKQVYKAVIHITGDEQEILGFTKSTSFLIRGYLHCAKNKTGTAYV